MVKKDDNLIDFVFLEKQMKRLSKIKVMFWKSMTFSSGQNQDFIV